jgi:hypothetical protein
MEKHVIDRIYRDLQERKIHPSGRFDTAGRFYLKNADCVSVRQPSRRYPYSEMSAGRTKKYLINVMEKYQCKTETELRARL